MKFCCAGGCTNSTKKKKNIGLSFHKLPLTNKPLLKVWLTKMKRDERYFNINEHVRICCEHFLPSDFKELDVQKRHLKNDAVPTVFSWTKPSEEDKGEGSRSAIEKLSACRREDEEATDSASEGDGNDMTDDKSLISRKTQTSCDDFNDPFFPDTAKITACTHSFSFKHLLSKCSTKSQEKKLFTHFTGFNTHSEFLTWLDFILPGRDRKHLVYRKTVAGKSRAIDTSKLFESDDDNEHDECDDDTNVEQCAVQYRSTHKLSVEDEFLLMFMRLRMGLSDIDLSERFGVSESVVNNVFLTWINYVYITFGSLKIWPHRSIILANSPAEFLEKYENTIIIIDATELKIQTPSALQKHSESYSTYKSHTTLKCLIGVDPKGGVMFISQLYGGAISDKQIVKRSGFLEVLKQKIMTGELNEGDAIMADKGFDIQKELDTLKLKLNIPPFLRDRVGFHEDDVIKTQTIARHRIHVERAIGKIRRFRIFNSVIPVSMFGSINQIWTVACVLSNMQNPVLT